MPRVKEEIKLENLKSKLESLSSDMSYEVQKGIAKNIIKDSQKGLDWSLRVLKHYSEKMTKSGDEETFRPQLVASAKRLNEYAEIYCETLSTYFPDNYQRMEENFERELLGEVENLVSEEKKKYDEVVDLYIDAGLEAKRQEDLN